MPLKIISFPYNLLQIAVSFTAALFEKHDYYCLEKKQVVFFSQGSLPCVDIKGHFIMRKKHQVDWLWTLAIVDFPLAKWQWRFVLCPAKTATVVRVPGKGNQIYSLFWHRQCRGICNDLRHSTIHSLIIRSFDHSIIQSLENHLKITL